MAEEPPTILYLVRQPTEKKPERKRRNLIRLGVDKHHAYAWTVGRCGRTYDGCDRAADPEAHPDGPPSGLSTRLGHRASS